MLLTALLATMSPGAVLALVLGLLAVLGAALRAAVWPGLLAVGAGTARVGTASSPCRPAGAGAGPRRTTRPRRLGTVPAVVVGFAAAGVVVLGAGTWDGLAASGRDPTPLLTATSAESNRGRR